MGKHRKPENKRIRRAFKKVATSAALAVGSTAVAVSALFGAQGTAAATPDHINVFGQDISCSTTAVDDQTDWNTMFERQAAALQDEFYREAYDNFLAQFDKFKGQPLEEMAKNVNALIYDSIEYIPRTMYGFNAPVETVVSGNGDIQDFAALNYAVMLRLGVSPDQLLVMRFSNGGSTEAITALLVSPTPGGAPTDKTIVMANFPTIAYLSNVNNEWIVTHGEMTNLKPLGANNTQGQVCKPTGMS